MTAIQLLRQDIDSEIKSGTKMVVNWDMYLELEKQQIIDAFDCDGSPEPGEVWISNGVQYYDQTYK